MEMIQASVLNGLEMLHLRYAPVLKVVSMSVLRNCADVDDVLQDVFLEIWNRAGRFDPLKGSPRAWLSTLTHRRSIDRLRKRNAYLRVQDRLECESRIGDGGWTHVHEEASHSEMVRYLRSALATLPAAQRLVIGLAYHEDMTQREIAARTGIPLGTIKSRLELGMRKLGICLGDLDGRIAAFGGRAKHLFSIPYIQNHDWKRIQDSEH